MSCPILDLLSYSISFSLFFVHIPTTRSSLLIFISCHKISTTLLSYIVLDITLTYLISSTLKIFKQILLDKPLYYRWKNFVKHFYLFSTLNLLPKKKKYKQSFYIIFIHSYPLVDNYLSKEFDLNLGECIYSILVKLNWL